MALITYCGNVHPTRTFGDVLTHLEGPCRDVAALVASEDQPFPLGMWIPRTALEEAREQIGFLRKNLERNGLYVATFNAFPMDVFHGRSVKAEVYRPDWSSRERLDYTLSIAELAVDLDLDEVSISTVSGGFRPDDREHKIRSYMDNWLAFVSWAIEEESRSGCCVRLALEPEPFNTLEDHQDAISLWVRLREKALEKGIDQAELDRHLGLCFDTCHFSVRFVEPLKAWKALELAGVPVHKVQVSVAPRGMGQEGLKRLLALEEPIYLHQTFHRDTLGTIREYLDLGLVGIRRDTEGEWRTHFHVPVHWGERPETTGVELVPFLKYMGTLKTCPLLEVETYSFDALPTESKSGGLVNSIVKEITWCRHQLEGKAGFTQ